MFLFSQIVANPNVPTLQEEIDSRPRVSTFLDALVNYKNTIPEATDPDVKPPAPSAQMGTQLRVFFCSLLCVVRVCY